ncbi:hypothetical protein BsWGS_21061 [Bradybaena similaris]
MSGQSEVSRPRPGSDDSHMVGSDFPDGQNGSHGDEEGKLSEKLVQFMKAVKDIDDVLGTWVENSSSTVFVKMGTDDIVSLQNLKTSALDEIILDMDNKKLSSFGSYISRSDSVLREKLLVSTLPRQMQRPLSGVGASSEYQFPASDFSRLPSSKTTDDQNIPATNQTITVNENCSDIQLQDKEKPLSTFDLNFLKWRRSSESTLSTGNTTRQRALDTAACSSNIMNYTQRRNSDTSLKGRELSRLRRLENISNQNSPTGSISDIALLFQKLTKQASKTEGLKRRNSLDTSSLTNGSYKDDSSSSSSSTNLEKVNQFAESDADTEQKGRKSRDYKTMYSSAPNISSMGIAEMASPFSSQYDIRSNIKAGQPQPGMFRSSSLKVLNFFRNILPGEKPRTTQPPELPRRLSMDSQLASNRIPSFERNNIKLSKRTIKINRPDHSHAMYISAADTLGGLPEHEEINFARGQPRAHKHFLDPRVNDYLNFGRRASCPVILETEESDEHVSSRKFCLLSVKSKTKDFLSENSDAGDSDGTAHSSAESANRHSPSPRGILAGGSVECDITDSDPASGSSRALEENAPSSLLEGVTFIVEKRPTVQEGQPTLEAFRKNTHSTSDVSPDERNNRSNISPKVKSGTSNKMERRPNKVFKKKKRNTEQRAKYTHPAGIRDIPIIKISQVENLSSINNMTDKTTSDLSDQTQNNFIKKNRLKIWTTLNQDKNNSLVRNDSYLSISSWVGGNGSSSYFSDISSTDN